MGNNRTNMKNKLNQIIVTLIIVLSSLTAFGEIIEKQKIIISNDFEVVSNATFKSSITFGDITRSNWPGTTNNYEARLTALEVPYQTYSATVDPDAGGTCTIVYASGSLVKITATDGLTTLTFDNTDYPTNGVNRVAVELWAGTNDIGFAIATITNATAPTVSTNDWTSLYFRKSGTNTLWKGRD